MDGKSKRQQVDRWMEEPCRTFTSSFALPLILSFLLISFSSCIRDHVADCERNTTLTLRFAYADLTDDLFRNQIPFLDLLLFTSDTLLHQHIRIPSSDLSPEATFTLTVEPDAYFIIAWGGHRREVYLTPEAGLHLNDFRYHHDEEAIRSGHLYYAPSGAPRLPEPGKYIVSVEEGKETIHFLPFMSATHVVHIYIKGLEDITGAEAFLENIPAGYDAHLVPVWENPLAYTQHCVAEIVEGERIWKSSFYIPHFDNENEITAGVRVAEKGFCHTQSLAEHMRTHQLSVTDGSASEIHLVFEYREGVLVQITLPTWDSILTEGNY